MKELSENAWRRENLTRRTWNLPWILCNLITPPDEWFRPVMPGIPTLSKSRPDPMLRAMLYYLVSYRRDRSVNIIKIYPHPCPPMNTMGMMMMTGRVELVGYLVSILTQWTVINIFHGRTVCALIYVVPRQAALPRHLILSACHAKHSMELWCSCDLVT